MPTPIASSPKAKISPWKLYLELLRGALQAVVAAGWKLFTVMLGLYLLTVIAVFPLIRWLFREALRASGNVGVDLGTLAIGEGAGLSLIFLLLLGLIAFWLTSVQLVVLIVMLRRAQAGMSLTFKSVWSDAVRAFRKLARPSSLPLVFLLFVILPLSGFGFLDVLTSRIAVPQFISGELMKDTPTAIAWVALMVGLALANIKFALSLPIFASTDANGRHAMALSWKMVRFRPAVALVGAVLTVTVGAAVASGLLVLVVLLPTMLADAVAPAQSPVVAAFGLGIAHVVGAFVVALATVMVLAIALVLTERLAESGPVKLAWTEPSANTPTHLSQKAAGLTLAGVAVVAAAGLGLSSITPISNLAAAPGTLILAHRGYVAGGVENTIEALEAAADAGADMVEMDVMQTADGKFVVMHDTHLGRLAGQDVAVADLTLDELTQIEVHDHSGHSQSIPSLEEYVLRAKELDMPLLIEIKMGGLDTEDHVELLVEELESLGAMDGNIFHTLDHESVETLKRLRPDATVGYIMPFAGGALPETSADFIVVEEYTATSSVQSAAEAAGLGFFVWTVDHRVAQREKLRRGVDGIITDKPEIALESREAMRESTGFAPVLVDVMNSFLVF